MPFSKILLNGTSFFFFFFFFKLKNLTTFIWIYLFELINGSQDKIRLNRSDLETWVLKRERERERDGRVVHQAGRAVCRGPALLSSRNVWFHCFQDTMSRSCMGRRHRKRPSCPICEFLSPFRNFKLYDQEKKLNFIWNLSLTPTL